jgi:hypothetical protein
MMRIKTSHLAVSFNLNISASKKGYPKMWGWPSFRIAAAKDADAVYVHKGASPDDLIATLTPLLRKE